MASVTGVDDGAGFGVMGTSPTGSGVVAEGPEWAGVSASSLTGSGVSAFSDSGAGVLTLSNTGPGVSAQSVEGAAVVARSDRGDGVAATSGSAVGVRAGSGTDNGVFGRTAAADRAGVFGYTTINDGSAVAGVAQCADGAGVFGVAASKGTGVLGQATAGGTGVTAVGEYGVSARGGTGPGVEAWSTASDGVAGYASNRLASGVIGTNPTEGASGVAGISAAGTGVHAESVAGEGVVAYTQSGIGVRAVSERGVAVSAQTNGSGNPAMLARHLGDGVGVRASGAVGADLHGTKFGAVVEGAEFGATIKGPVCGAAIEGTTYGASVKGTTFGLSASADKFAVLASVEYGTAVMAASIEHDTIAATVLQLGAAIHAKAGNPKAPSTYAGLFEGDVTINGTLRKSSDRFLIDHPLDPRTKLLEHSVVESDEMRNLYDGTVVLNRRGRATVRLARWFEALNTDVRYQLTAIGGPAPELHVATELEDGSFEIAGGPPGAKVCWQVTGVRQDAWARANPMVVERRKVGKERGRYLHPELFDAPPDSGLLSATNPMPIAPEPFESPVVERRPDEPLSALVARQPRALEPPAERRPPRSSAVE